MATQRVGAVTLMNQMDAMLKAQGKPALTPHDRRAVIQKVAAYNGAAPYAKGAAGGPEPNFLQSMIAAPGMKPAMQQPDDSGYRSAKLQAKMKNVPRINVVKNMDDAKQGVAHAWDYALPTRSNDFPQIASVHSPSSAIAYAEKFGGTLAHNVGANLKRIPAGLAATANAGYVAGSAYPLIEGLRGYGSGEGFAAGTRRARETQGHLYKGIGAELKKQGKAAVEDMKHPITALKQGAQWAGHNPIDAALMLDMGLGTASKGVDLVGGLLGKEAMGLYPGAKAALAAKAGDAVDKIPVVGDAIRNTRTGRQGQAVVAANESEQMVPAVDAVNRIKRAGKKLTPEQRAEVGKVYMGHPDASTSLTPTQTSYLRTLRQHAGPLAKRQALQSGMTEEMVAARNAKQADALASSGKGKPPPDTGQVFDAPEPVPVKPKTPTKPKGKSSGGSTYTAVYDMENGGEMRVTGPESSHAAALKANPGMKLKVEAKPPTTGGAGEVASPTAAEDSSARANLEATHNLKDTNKRGGKLWQSKTNPRNGVYVSADGNHTGGGSFSAASKEFNKGNTPPASTGVPPPTVPVEAAAPDVAPPEPVAPVTPQVEAPAPPTPFPSTKPHHIQDMGGLAKVIWGERSPERAVELIDPGTVSPLDYYDQWWSDRPELALGQGTNKGVTLEMDTNGLSGKAGPQKPGLAMTGGGEYITKHNDQTGYLSNLRGITVKPEVLASKRDPTAIRLQRVLDSKVEKEGWIRTANADGSVTVSRPDVAQSAPAPASPSTPQVEAPTPSQTGYTEAFTGLGLDKSFARDQFAHLTKTGRTIVPEPKIQAAWDAGLIKSEDDVLRASKGELSPTIGMPAATPQPRTAAGKAGQAARDRVRAETKATKPAPPPEPALTPEQERELWYKNMAEAEKAEKAARKAAKGPPKGRATKEGGFGIFGLHAAEPEVPGDIPQELLGGDYYPGWNYAEANSPAVKARPRVLGQPDTPSVHEFTGKSFTDGTYDPDPTSAMQGRLMAGARYNALKGTREDIMRRMGHVVQPGEDIPNEARWAEAPALNDLLKRGEFSPEEMGDTVFGDPSIDSDPMLQDYPKGSKPYIPKGALDRLTAAADASRPNPAQKYAQMWRAQQVGGIRSALGLGTVKSHLVGAGTNAALMTPGIARGVADTLSGSAGEVPSMMQMAGHTTPFGDLPQSEGFIQRSLAGHIKVPDNVPYIGGADTKNISDAVLGAATKGDNAIGNTVANATRRRMFSDVPWDQLTRDQQLDVFYNGPFNVMGRQAYLSPLGKRVNDWFPFMAPTVSSFKAGLGSAGYAPKNFLAADAIGGIGRMAHQGMTAQVPGTDSAFDEDTRGKYADALPYKSKTSHTGYRWNRTASGHATGMAYDATSDQRALLGRLLDPAEVGLGAILGEDPATGRAYLMPGQSSVDNEAVDQDSLGRYIKSRGYPGIAQAAASVFPNANFYMRQYAGVNDPTAPGAAPVGTFAPWLRKRGLPTGLALMGQVVDPHAYAGIVANAISPQGPSLNPIENQIFGRSKNMQAVRHDPQYQPLPYRP